MYYFLLFKAKLEESGLGTDFAVSSDDTGVNTLAIFLHLYWGNAKNRLFIFHQWSKRKISGDNNQLFASYQR